MLKRKLTTSLKKCSTRSKNLLESFILTFVDISYSYPKWTQVIHLSDDYSCYGYSSLIDNKSRALKTFKIDKEEVEGQL